MKDSIINFLAGFEKENIEKSFPLPYCLPVYHCVSDESLPHIKNVIKYKNVRQFEEDLDEFSKHFQFVNWDEFKEFVNGNFKPKKKIALLTFDDGFREFYDIVVPILERKGIYAVNFINPAFIDNQDLMFRCKASLIVDRLEKTTTVNPEIHKIFSSKEDIKTQLLKIRYAEREKLDQAAKILDIDFSAFLKEQKPYLSFDQLNILTQKGFGISSHSWDHPRYHELSLQHQLETTHRTFEYLKEHHFLYESFAFPFTDFGVSKAFFNEVFKNKEMFCIFGSAGIKLDSVDKIFHRIPMETVENAAKILKKEIIYFKLKKFLNKNKIIRR
ncbi:polysaccharide deacetylase family protein [Chryseobacterium sp. JUb7]|uniref:polysaccharide deacetylase family protein n=1 Tax=Chryseobacterium sp. JUb7 TaxID=2940599 RepID=UPI002169C6FC|nr:polysaccharide deacetylase family protein [Chryseobacterium sp. JUb7]MCS3529730.1 peptidoglycan/xylan/chitin deacetylase (PgdA/CDA1 family) [Chryseobacterium sp. JUb7]